MSERDEILQERDYDNSTKGILENIPIESIANPFERHALIEYKKLLSLYFAEQSNLHKIQNKLYAITNKKSLFKKMIIRKLRQKAKDSVALVNSYDRELLEKENSKHIILILMREKQKIEQIRKIELEQSYKNYKEEALKQAEEISRRWKEDRKKAVEAYNKKHGIK